MTLLLGEPCAVTYLRLGFVRHMLMSSSMSVRPEHAMQTHVLATCIGIANM